MGNSGEVKSAFWAEAKGEKKGEEGKKHEKSQRKVKEGMAKT